MFKLKRTFVKLCLLLLTLLIVSGCQNSPEIVPEFDGVYISASGKLTTIENINEYSHIWKPKAASNLYAASATNVKWLVKKIKRVNACITKQEGFSVKLSSGDFGAFIVKGIYEFKVFSLHHVDFIAHAPSDKINEQYDLAEKNIIYGFDETIGKKLGLDYKTSYTINNKMEVATAGEKIEVNRKKIADNTYCFAPKSKLKPGYYVGWLGEELWWFEII